MLWAMSPTASLAAADVLPAGGAVLVVRLSALGDVLFALETVAALHRERPDARIDFLVEDRFAGLLQGHPQLRSVLVYPRRHKAAIPASLWRLRRQRYDLVLDLHGIQKSAWHVLLSRGRLKVGAAAPVSREGAAFAYHRSVTMPGPALHRAEVGHRLLAALGFSGESAAPVLPAEPAPAELFAGLTPPHVLLFPGTSAFAAFKRWPAARFGELAQRLVASGRSVLVGCGPGERELVAPVVAAAPSVRLVDGGPLGLRGLAGVLGRCAVVVAADTGPLHIAAAMGARCVALFGPKDSERYGPRAQVGRLHEVLWAAVPCRPCTRRSCASPQCVLGISVDAVEAAVQRQCAAAEAS